jgi:3-methyladenine DNA glycosylase AlkD
MSLASKTPEPPNKLQQLHRSIVEAFEAHADPKWAAVSQRFHKHEVACYGTSSAAWKEILRPFRRAFRQLSLAERLQLAEQLLETRILEEASIAVHLWALSVDDLTPAHFPHLERGLDRFNSWGTTDGFCINVLQPLLRRHRKEVLALLRKWNRSENRWKRRASVVAFVRKIGATGEFVDETLELCENLIWDKDDMVQKGVGWALKDTMRGAKDKVLEYVKDLRHRGVPSTITLYAIRDLKGAERQAVLAIRGTRSGKGR